jgi:putative flippase GtrA
VYRCALTLMKASEPAGASRHRDRYSGRMRDEASVLEAHHRARPPVDLRLHVRFLHGVRHPANWLQLVRFSLVGASGYLLNLVVYALCVKVVGIQYLAAEALAWILAAGNNFVWNRHWTFKARDGQIHVQAVRFLLVSLLALAVNLLVLRVLVESAGMDKLAAEVIALGASTPLNFLGNKLWSFRLEP